MDQEMKIVLLPDGQLQITLTWNQVETLIAQGDDGGFNGNDLLYPIYQEIKKAYDT